MTATGRCIARRRARGLPVVGALVALGLGLMASSARAETVRVRSGDHPTFSRLVLPLDARRSWQLGRSGETYVLRVDSADVAFDLGAVFDKISRSRIASVRAGSDPGTLEIGLACDCHATGFDHGRSDIVIDVTDGPAPAGSPFEAPPGVTDATGAGRAEVAGDALFRAAPPGPAPSRALPLVVPSAVPLPWLALPQPAFGSAGTDRSMSAADRPEQPDPVEAATAELPSEDPGMAGSESSESTQVPDPADAPSTAELALPVPATGRPVWARPSGVAVASVLPETVDDPGGIGAGGATAAGDLALRRIDSERLLEELARAASQGLVESRLPSIDGLRRRAPGDLPTAPGEAGFGSEALPGEGAGSERIFARTVIDRDTGTERVVRSLSDRGTACIPDSRLDLAAWGDAEVPEDGLEGLALRRAALVGEFDSPDAGKVRDLVRYYLWLGFGVEARSVLEDFAGDMPEMPVEAALADLIEGDAPLDSATLAGQEGCSGRSALWATLAAPEGTLPEGAARPAIVAAFSELPAHLRHRLGPGLAARFLAADDRAATLMIRNAMARSGARPGPEARLLDARIALADGDPGARAILEEVAAGNGEAAREAFALLLEGDIAGGEVDDSAVDVAASFARERTGTPAGDTFEALSLRAMIASGDFASARDGIARLAEGGTDAGELGALWSDYALALTALPDDARFLREAFASRPMADQPLAPEVRATFARRLTELGFSGEALLHLREPVGNPDLRVVRGEALLAAGDTRRALEAVAGLDSPGAMALRERIAGGATDAAAGHAAGSDGVTHEGEAHGHDPVTTGGPAAADGAAEAVSEPATGAETAAPIADAGGDPLAVPEIEVTPTEPPGVELVAGPTPDGGGESAAAQDPASSGVPEPPAATAALTTSETAERLARARDALDRARAAREAISERLGAIGDGES